MDVLLKNSDMRINEELIRNLIALRHELHEIPELAFEETETIKILEHYLRKHTTLQVEHCGKWFYAYYDCGHPSSTIAFRADFDAVAGQDGNPGHYCGHDGHASILAGFGRYISETRPDRNVLLIFQPAEEVGKGALICRDILSEKKVDEIYGFHNIPEYERNAVLLLENTFACASTGMEITITGSPSHAAYPEAGKNPSELIARLILNQSKYRAIGQKGLVLVTVIGADIGSDAYGVSASEGSLRLTVRAEYEEEFQLLIRTITEDAQNMAAEAGMKVNIELIETFPATENDKACVKKVEEAAKRAAMKVVNPDEPFRWSEDFGYYLQVCPGAYIGIGDGEDWSQLHTEHYEFPDEIIGSVLELYAELLRE